MYKITRQFLVFFGHLFCFFFHTLYFGTLSKAFSISLPSILLTMFKCFLVIYFMVKIWFRILLPFQKPLCTSINVASIIFLNLLCNICLKILIIQSFLCIDTICPYLTCIFQVFFLLSFLHYYKCFFLFETFPLFFT